MTKDLFASFAVVALFVAFWALSQEWIRSWPRALRMSGAGVYMGLAAVTAMVMAVQFSSGVIFDLRTIVLGLAGLFAGPVAALIAGLIAAVYRVWLGGAGLSAGLFAIAVGCLSGCLAFYIRSRLGSWKWSLTAFTAIQTCLPLVAMLLLPSAIRLEAFYQAFLPLAGLNLVASLLSATSIETSRRRGWLAHLLKSAIRQAPDYFYIKDKASKIVMANEGVVSASGVSSHDDLVGKTDFDFTTPERAQLLFAQEQDILRSGRSLTNSEETITANDGVKRTFVTTKTPIKNADGTITGLIGVTKDLTQRVTLERQLREKQNELEVVLSGMSDGLARFDAQNRLIFLNDNYRDLFPLTGSVRKPGATLGEILDNVIITGEQVLGDVDPDQWKQSVLESTTTGGDEEVQMADGRWLRIRSQPLDGGGAVVIVSDYTTLKMQEMQLLGVAEQFRVLATTDPLTQLQNRRDFDQTLEREFRHAMKASTPVSLLMLDIDHFKSYNDEYGHPAGDACLRQIAACIGSACKRGGDMAARYGGEEFAVILPGTDAAGASAVAAKVLATIERLAIPHRGSPKGFVSVSIGMASLPQSRCSDATSFLKLADSALYDAKNAGRGRISQAS